MQKKYETGGNLKEGVENNTWALFEEGTIHTKDLSEAEAEEMLERHKRIFPDLEWYIQDIKGRYSDDEIFAKGGIIKSVGSFLTKKVTLKDFKI